MDINTPNKPSGMVALLPSTAEWTNLDLPHVTLIYVGEIDGLDPFIYKEISRITSALASLSSPFYSKVSGIEVFGEEEKVDVLRLVPSVEMLAMRDFLLDFDTSEFKEYKPHATIGPIGSFKGMWPLMLCFDRLYLGWGDINLTFWLRKN